MNLKLIACNVFFREACHCLARSSHRVDVEFTELGDHIHSDTLRGKLQALIDAASASERKYDAILILFGICGNATVGLKARQVPLVVPRAHDCCTILLGSRELFRRHFQDNPSTPFSSTGYFERGNYYLRTEEGGSVIHYGDAYAEYVSQYGEENARYIWETMHPTVPPELQDRAVFIDLPETAALGYAEQFKAKAEAEGKTYVCLQGNLRLIESLINGQWNSEDFLIVPPQEQIVGIYDWSEIIRSQP